MPRSLSTGCRAVSELGGTSTCPWVDLLPPLLVLLLLLLLLGRTATWMARRARADDGMINCCRGRCVASNGSAACNRVMKGKGLSLIRNCLRCFMTANHINTKI